VRMLEEAAALDPGNPTIRTHLAVAGAQLPSGAARP
jgi:hypothetical protein